MTANDSHMRQRKSATKSHYAAETRDILHSYLYLLLTIAEHRLPPEQTSEIDNKFQTIRCMGSVPGTLPAGQHKLGANPTPLADTTVELSSNSNIQRFIDEASSLPTIDQDANNMECLGWLLYSAEEFECKALRHEIRQLTGIDVALNYQVIEGDNSNSSKLQTKAIHLELNRNASTSRRHTIAKLYSSDSNTFPLDIRMRLIPEYGALTNG